MRESSYKDFVLRTSDNDSLGDVSSLTNCACQRVLRLVPGLWPNLHKALLCWRELSLELIL